MFSSPTLTNNIPLWISLFDVSFRLLSVCYLAARVHETAAKTSHIINSVPIGNTVAEIKQFHDFLATTKIALSGMGFFSLTKGLMLKVKIICILIVVR